MHRMRWPRGFLLLVVALGWGPAAATESLTRHPAQRLSMALNLVEERCADAAIISPGRAVLWDGDRIVELGTLGGEASYASAINDAGQVVGEADTRTNGCQAFLWEDGQMRALDIGDAISSSASDINAAGHVVGTISRPDGTVRAVLWEGGRMTDLGTLGGESAEAAAINDAGQVVGGAETADGGWHAFLWEAGQMTDLSAHDDDYS